MRSIQRLWKWYLSELQSARPIRTGLVVFLCVILFALEFVEGLRRGASVQDINAFLFLNLPGLIWLLAPFLHGGLAHIVGNTVGLLVLSPIFENRVDGRSYWLYFILTASLTIASGAFVESLTTDREVAYYGISGFLYMLLSYSGLTLNYGREGLYTVRLILGLLIVVIPVYRTAQLILVGTVPNGGHFAGLVLGLLFFYRERSTIQS